MFFFFIYKNTHYNISLINKNLRICYIITLKNLNTACMFNEYSHQKNTVINIKQLNIKQF